MPTYIMVKTNFESFHSWKDAPDSHAFLRNKHRHLFYVKAKWQVNHDDRDLEFFAQKEKLEEFIFNNIRNKNLSCEQMAQIICDNLECVSVEVWEDNENGAEYIA